jgi:hypothetical protein
MDVWRRGEIVVGGVGMTGSKRVKVAVHVSVPGESKALPA